MNIDNMVRVGARQEVDGGRAHLLVVVRTREQSPLALLLSQKLRTARFAAYWEDDSFASFYRSLDHCGIKLHTPDYHWRPKLQQWIDSSGGLSFAQPAVSVSGKSVNETMKALVENSRVETLSAEGRAVIELAPDKSVRIETIDGVTSLANMRQLRLWIDSNVSVVAEERPDTEVASWMVAMSETGPFRVDMSEQTMPASTRPALRRGVVTDWRFRTEDGSLRQRLTRLLATRDLDPEDRDALMRVVREEYDIYTGRVSDQDIYMDITRDLAWERGEFGDERSCFWTSRVRDRNALQAAGAFALRTWVLEGGRMRGTGRTWAVVVNSPTGPAVALFNSYGRYSLLQVSGIVEHITGHAFRSDVYLARSTIHLNGSNVKVFDGESVHSLRISPKRPRVGRFKRTVRCRLCAREINPKGTEPIHPGNLCAKCAEKGGR